MGPISFTVCLHFLHASTLVQGMSVPVPPYSVYQPQPPTYETYQLDLPGDDDLEPLGPGEACSPTMDLCREGLTCSDEEVCVIKLGGNCENFENLCEPGSMCEDNICKIAPGERCGEMDPPVECGYGSTCENKSLISDDTFPAHCLIQPGGNCSDYPFACSHGFACDMMENACVNNCYDTVSANLATGDSFKVKVLSALGQLAEVFFNMFNKETSLQEQVTELQADLGELLNETAEE